MIFIYGTLEYFVSLFFWLVLSTRKYLKFIRCHVTLIKILQTSLPFANTFFTQFLLYLNIHLTLSNHHRDFPKAPSDSNKFSDKLIPL